LRIFATPAIERFFQFSLLGLVACAFCALADTGRLDLPSLAFLLAGVFWRGLMAAGLVRLNVPQRLITLVATGYLIFYPIDYYFLSRDFFAATAHGVCFLGVARILAARSNRDYLYTGALAFVALLGAAALSTQIRFLGWLTAAIIFSLGALTSAEIRRGFQRNTRSATTPGRRAGVQLALLVAVAACSIVALTAGLFLLIPRTARAAAMLMPGGPRLTGFTHSMDLGGVGDIGRIARDTRPVLHIRANSGTLPPDLKWRGSALSEFDGRRWAEPAFRGVIVPAQGTTMVADRLQRSRRDGERLVYRVDMASSDTGTLFIAGVPEYIQLVVGMGEAARLARDTEDSFRALPAAGEPLEYEVSAENGAPLPYLLSNSERARNLRLPEALDHRIPELGRKWLQTADSESGGLSSDAARAARIEDRLHREFTYSLENSKGRDPLAEFLFVTKRGYCEYFASAMAVLLRTQGIPARVVTGFQSGYYNDVSGAWVMRASDAHAWVEAWIEGRGWVTFDPTPPGAVAEANGRWEYFTQRMGMYLDAADTVWQQWVVAYNPGQQIALAFSFRNKLRSMGRDENGFTWPSASALLAEIRPMRLLALLAAGAVLLFIIFGKRLRLGWNAGGQMRRIRRGEATTGDAAALYERMLRLMARRGFQKPAWFTPNEFAKNLPSPEREAVDAFTATYNEVRFGRAGAGIQRLAGMLEEMEVGSRLAK